MSSKEVKAALKSARDAIKNKEFKEALKHCKAVLKLEKSNYNAWVFIGVAAGELEQPEQAQTAYRKAVELEPEQLLAWQGLANLYEKTDQWDFKIELPNVYEKLVELYASSDKNKCYEMIGKLKEIHQSDKEYSKLANIWLRLIRLKEEDGADEKELLQLWQQLTCLLSDCLIDNEHDTEIQKHLITAFEKAMLLVHPRPGEEHRKLSSDYIKCLSKLPGEEEKLKKACEAMLPLYPAQSYPLEVLCSYYLKQGVQGEDAASCFSRLCDLAPDNGLCDFGFGTKALQEGRFKDAIRDLARGLKKMNLSPAWYSLAEAQLKVHKYSDCSKSCAQGLTACATGDKTLRIRLLKLRLEALVRCGGEKAADQALETFTLIPDAVKDPLLVALKGRAYLNKGLIDEALKVSSHLVASNPNLAQALVLRGLAHLADDKQQQAEQSFLKAAELSPNCGECFFLLGRLYWTMGEETRKDKSKAHSHLLKAAKLDPHLSFVFRYLGNYYREVVNDSGRARGCFKKAFDLDNDDAESGAAAVDLSMAHEDMITALAILQSVTEKATPGSAKWAWMRRGLYYLKIGQHQQAIADLQAALRADPEDWVCWECLGEAYLNRQSFTAALKAFGKAHSLQPSSIYSVYQAAAIKQTLGKFKEAIAEYLQITAQHNYVPALKGLGECQLSLAKSLMEDCRDGGAIDLIEQAIQNLFKAVVLRSDLSCLWKLLGDACSAVSAVSPNRAKVQVPATLAGLDAHAQVHVLNQAQTLRVAERCYTRALKLKPEVTSLWSDLGLNFYHQSRLACDAEEDGSLLLQKAQQCLKKAIMMDSGNHSYWNALGVINTSKGLQNLALAQHCFIKSIQVEPNNVVAWTNLGTLYMKKDNIELAHEAFKVAQSLEPLYVNCWIGQALIAEKVGSFEAMDLFRHTTELRTHTEGVKGYAYWVCSTLLDKSNRDSELYRYNIVQMNAISAAQVALSKYTERFQSDADAFIMLGFMTEHLQLKRQAVQAYQRAVELLRSTSLTEQLCFALSNYARALCACGRCEEAVHVYNSTPLEELSDLAGLALAYCKAGHIPESSSAYERALAMASTEKETAYILTALSLLQHKQGNLDSAKTLLFKCSMLKEPVPESLLCLCALGLAHNDVTLAAAARTELFKQGSSCATVVEQRCLLTCTLLALQGNYSAVQREASRAVHSYPGNPSLWSLLSRLVPQYYPRKANGGAMAGHVACLSSMTQGKRALLYSGVNQLANGRHSGEDAQRNALKTMQRAVLLCPDDPSAWAGLMAACHTENTSSYLRGSAACRQGLEQTLMSVVSEKVRSVETERPLAQSLEKWVLQQAVSGLLLSGQLDQAEALCSQVLNVSPERPAIMLSLRQVQCQRLLETRGGSLLSESMLEQLSNAVMLNPSNIGALHWLAAVYCSQGLLVQAVMALKHSLQLSSQLGLHSSQVASLLRLALVALRPCMAGVPGNDQIDLVGQATTEALKLGSSLPVAVLFQALLQYITQKNKRETRRLLEKLVYGPCQEVSVTVVQVASWYLLRHLHCKNDQEFIHVLLEHAKKNGDQRLLDLHSQLVSSS
ncbi:tetratricopeptide repeat protein 37 [Nerophis lumbriciformis]|uniref:tetratricopeptide repeat protein 37 n=1 Tax=Nerophis lumbriciformis TaxID=546530 RepID=UPI002ADFBCF7|nr:tetratricopeptide repeat protein 37-like [Nerophis lumbriciformis]XP_061842585.1 tetratricopeptide repeat protein 37-like [Nerophis lumbriciformis]XP_061842586.1 tetratricopeptide repeat protein 37-like [Nerophis lumbriciformis]XP_061842587.1 tetratricopeptide repeat protein 37-like [Nerophis lumbriciformis]